MLEGELKAFQRGKDVFTLLPTDSGESLAKYLSLLTSTGASKSDWSTLNSIAR